MSTVNSWWANLPQERFWLTVAGGEEGKDVLVFPEAESSDVASWVSGLPAYVPPRDVLFHYDPGLQAITAWSRARGPAQHHEPGWSLRGGLDPDGRWRRTKWVIKLRARKTLERPVSIDEIAHLQWDLFPALRALEDKMGDPLYYPFAMGNPTETHPLPGRLFKLPALFVERFPVLASVAQEARVSGPARPARRAHSLWDAIESVFEERPKAASRAR
jgi:hypothetical protein